MRSPLEILIRSFLSLLVTSAVLLIGFMARADIGNAFPQDLPKKALGEALEARLGVDARVTQITPLRSQLPTPLATDYQVKVLLAHKHRATCDMRMIGDKAVVVLNQCSSRTAEIEAQGLMSFAELGIEQTTAQP